MDTPLPNFEPPKGFRTRVLRPIRRAAVRGFYFGRDTYTMKLRGRRTTFSIQGPASFEFFYSTLAFNRIPEKPVAMQFSEDMQSARCFVDIGANLGYYTCMAQTFMESGEIHAFEMDVDNNAILKRNVGLNQSSAKVTANHVALSDSAGEITYQRPRTTSSPVLSMYYNPYEGAEVIDVKVPTVTLTDYFADRETQPDLVKIDVEGAELAVLRGMVDLLPGIARMYVEIHPRVLMAAGGSAREVLELLAQHFKLFVIPQHRQQHKTHDWVEITPSTDIPHNTMVLATR